MKADQTLAIIGGGPSALFTLQHILEEVEGIGRAVSRIHVFERGRECGPGMPYSREHTSPLNLSNISSEELPQLPQTFADWLRGLTSDRLNDLGISGEIREDEIYPRVALGDYFRDQFDSLCSDLSNKGIPVERHVREEVKDIVPSDGGYRIVAAGTSVAAHIVVIATGHAWAPDEGGMNYASPWPIQKLLPREGDHHNFPVGLLGASLSAVDVINVLANHHGTFHEDDGLLAYVPAVGCEDFRLVMHSMDGLLSHLQFEQVSPMRELFRHCSEDEIRDLCDSDGHLRLSRYFDVICRPALVEALREDGMSEEADAMRQPGFGFEDFSEMMKEMHASRDPFRRMGEEFLDARAKIRGHQPTRWKEVLDDLMYTLNFHASLLPAEDHLLLKGKILPFVMTVMAALPLKSAKILMAVHDAGRLELIQGKAKVEAGPKGQGVRVATDDEGAEKIYEYKMFIDCTGQAPVDKSDFPFPSLVEAGLVTRSIAPFASDTALEGVDPKKIRTIESGDFVLELGGMAVSDDYKLISSDGHPVEGLYDIAVPHAVGLRPYCYGLQACNEAAGILVKALISRDQCEDGKEPNT